MGFDGSRCVYRRTAALGCGVLAALLALAGLVLVSAASGCFGRYGGGSAPATGRRRSSALKLSILAWYVPRTNLQHQMLPNFMSLGSNLI